MYEENFGERLLDTALDGDEDTYQTLLSAVVACRAPLFREFVVELFGGDARKAGDVVAKASLVLNVSPETGAVSVFHKSVRDWLVGDLAGSATPRRLQVDARRGHAVLARLCEARVRAEMAKEVADEERDRLRAILQGALEVAQPKRAPPSPLRGARRGRQPGPRRGGNPRRVRRRRDADRARGRGGAPGAAGRGRLRGGRGRGARH